MPSQPALDDVDAARALSYRMLGHALARPPDSSFLDRLARLEGGDAPLGTALRAIAAHARQTTVAVARSEYDTLFIGVARGELLPYASFYLTGFLHERPLARIRADLPILGLARAPTTSDPEDHIAFLCEVMATLIEQPDPMLQQSFFARHLAPWAISLFTDLERANAARLYRPIGTLGRLLIELDRQGFEYAQVPDHDRGAA